MAGQLEIGDVVAHRYQLKNLLGAGGYGSVYEALDMVRGNSVALKVMHAHVAKIDQGRKRFEREATTVKNLQHPGIVELFDFGVDDDDMPYIAFEMLEGRTLGEELKLCSSLPLERAADIARQVLQALQLAHAHQVVHRDIKPANIFLCGHSGSVDKVKVLDFGIAKELGDERKTALTNVGQMLGTAQYMAPEQVRGEAVDATVDLYALGATLSEMLVGQTLVQGGTAIEVFIHQVEDKPLPLPPQLDHSPLRPIVERAVAKPREQRFNSAAQMLEQLNTVMGFTSTPLSQPNHAVSSSLTPSFVNESSGLGSLSNEPSASFSAVSGNLPRPASAQPTAVLPPSSPLHPASYPAAQPFSAPQPSVQAAASYAAATAGPRPPFPAHDPQSHGYASHPPTGTTQQGHAPPATAAWPASAPQAHNTNVPPTLHSQPVSPDMATSLAPSTTASNKPNNWPWIAALAVCAIVIGGLSAGLIMQRSGDDDGAEKGASQGSTRTVKPNQQGPSAANGQAPTSPKKLTKARKLKLAAGKLNHINKELFIDRLKAMGANVEVKSDTNTPGMMSMLVLDVKGPMNGNVQLVRYDQSQAQAAQNHYKELPENEFLSARFDGETVVMVMVFGESPERVIDALTRSPLTHACHYALTKEWVVLVPCSAFA